MAGKHKPKLAVWKFASCDGCQLCLLDCEDELLAVAGAVEIANFPEASRQIIKGPYDVSLVEGSISTPHDAERIHKVRRSSKFLVSIGSCATAGGIQALRNFKDVNDFISMVYTNPEYIETLNKSTPIADHVFVDFELRGCPINKYQLIELISALLNNRKPNIYTGRLRGALSII
jgi:coenzyme F420-reducing hydrogenase gamma subunit